MKKMPLSRTVFSEQGATVGAGNQRIPTFSVSHSERNVTLMIINVTLLMGG